MERTWKFNMDRKNGPEWLVYEDDKLVAYARRAKEAGWFVRVSEFNPTPNTEKIYIDDDVYPINFMKLMLEMHKKETP